MSGASVTIMARVFEADKQTSVEVLEAGAANAGTQISKDEILEIPCDVLVPAAIGGVITGEAFLSGPSQRAALHADRVPD